MIPRIPCRKVLRTNRVLRSAPRSSTRARPGPAFCCEAASFRPQASRFRRPWWIFGTCENSGEYDFAGFNLRGRQLSDKVGRFEFLTIEAVPYGGRTAHFHFKVSAVGYEPLTTELYLPGLSQNTRDSAFRSSNLLQAVDEAGIRKGWYEFYLRQL